MTNPDLHPTSINTDKEIWRKTPGDYYSPSIHVTKEGSIGINIAGLVFVMPADRWHELARRFSPCSKEEKMPKPPRECKCVYESDCHGIEMIKSPSGRAWAIGGTMTQDRWSWCPWCGGFIVNVRSKIEHHEPKEEKKELFGKGVAGFMAEEKKEWCECEKPELCKAMYSDLKDRCHKCHKILPTPTVEIPSKLDINKATHFLYQIEREEYYCKTINNIITVLNNFELLLKNLEER